MIRRRVLCVGGALVAQVAQVFTIAFDVSPSRFGSSRAPSFLGFAAMPYDINVFIGGRAQVVQVDDGFALSDVLSLLRDKGGVALDVATRDSDDDVGDFVFIGFHAR